MGGWVKGGIIYYGWGGVWKFLTLLGKICPKIWTLPKNLKKIYDSLFACKMWATAAMVMMITKNSRNKQERRNKPEQNQMFHVPPASQDRKEQIRLSSYHFNQEGGCLFVGGGGAKFFTGFKSEPGFHLY